ncbi:hypothetical protein GCM10010960_00360 [Arenimonas maotaiensis]|uniref:Zinc-binding protein n=1 Tax=Arenimonas maotaiensis TaxID=1446479 RepID=A0A917CE55_9GAMM|nr:putative zinc-binding protein [Arenimonas maotaiensis]GGF82218.1 hypothetical protein GCM10010960_00360 [Arenimonas maotaiensis]
MKKKLPLVYACSGCSSAAQMANQMALWLDRQGKAEMSCIAGVGGGVTGLVNTARSHRPIIALDGCILACASACLSQVGVTPDRHIVLSEFEVKKRKHVDFDPAQAHAIYDHHIVPIAERLTDSALHSEKHHDKN